eukprot:UN28039
MPTFIVIHIDGTNERHTGYNESKLREMVNKAAMNAKKNDANSKEASNENMSSKEEENFNELIKVKRKTFPKKV